MDQCSRQFPDGFAIYIYPLYVRTVPAERPVSYFAKIFPLRGPAGRCL